MKKPLPLLALLALAAVGQAQISKSGTAGYLFRMKYTKGSTLRYAVASSITGMSEDGQPMKITLPMVWKVVGVANGVATIDTTVGPVSLNTKPVGQPTQNRIQIDSVGKLVGQAGSGQQVTPTFPAKPVKVGQSWSSATVTDIPMQGPQKVTATYTFKGLKVVGGKQMAELAVKTTGQTTGTGSMLLLVSDGSLYKSNLTLNLKMKDANGAPVNYKVNAVITRK